MTKGVRKDILTDEELEFLINNLGKISFTKIARIIQIGNQKLKRICEENKIYYPQQKFRDWEIEILKVNKDLSLQEIHNKFLPHRTKLAIGNQSNVLGIKRRKGSYTKEEDEYLIKNYKKLSYLELETYLDRTYDSITARAMKLKIKRTNDLTHVEYCEYIKTNSSIIVVEGIFTGFNDCELKFKCLIHDYEWITNSRNVFNTLRCPKCQFNKKRDHNDFVIEVGEANQNILVLGQFTGMKEKIEVCCLKHDYIWMADPGKLLLGRGCPICSESHGERKISNYLKKYDINFTPQKRFSDCKIKHPLPFDFCVYDFNGNIFEIIEYQGSQHFVDNGFFGGHDNFEKRREYDQFKRNYCKNNGLKLLEIEYTDFDGIETILENELLILRKEIII